MVSISLLLPSPSSHPNAPIVLPAPAHPTHPLVSGRRPVFSRLNLFCLLVAKIARTVSPWHFETSIPSVIILACPFLPRDYCVACHTHLHRARSFGDPQPVGRSDTDLHTHTYGTTSTSGSDVLGLVLCLARTHLLTGVCHCGPIVSLAPNFTCLIISPIFPPRFGAVAESQKSRHASQTPACRR